MGLIIAITSILTDPKEKVMFSGHAICPSRPCVAVKLRHLPPPMCYQASKELIVGLERPAPSLEQYSFHKLSADSEISEEARASRHRRKQFGR